MRKYIALVLALVCALGLVGCGTMSIDSVIENKPSVTGIVEEVHNDYVIMYSATADGYPNGSRWSVPLKAENQDSYKDLAVGDEIVVYYDGSAMETDPLQVAEVYAITLKTPANKLIYGAAHDPNADNSKYAVPSEGEPLSSADEIKSYLN